MCVKAELISTRLLSKEDKQDMVAGLIPMESLIVHVKVWVRHGMCNYAEGKFERFEARSQKEYRSVRVGRR
jgi:hypothetical protein